MKEFSYGFQVTRTVVFEVEYYTLGSNSHPYLATSAGRFIRSKKDFERCGQCQKEVLPKNSAARAFYDKWSNMHLKELSQEQYYELNKDIEKLKEQYNYDCNVSDRFGDKGDGGAGLSFNRLVELSMQPLKRSIVSRTCQDTEMQGASFAYEESVGEECEEMEVL